jgi:hypothetical protein
MGQFMGQQFCPPCGGGLKLPRPKNNVRSDGISQGLHGAGRFRRPLVGMNAHRAKVMSKARLHEGARGRIQRLAGRAQNVMDNGRGHGPRPNGWRGGGGFALQALLFAFLAFTIRTRRAAAGTLALEPPAARRHHDRPIRRAFPRGLDAGVKSVHNLSSLSVP